MVFLIYISAAIFTFILVITYMKSLARNKVKLTLIQRFRKNFLGSNGVKVRIEESFSNSLMSDPKKNIKIGLWDNEVELRTKADIHRARLNKYGRSMMNGEMIYLGPKDVVFKYTKDGEKKYL